MSIIPKNKEELIVIINKNSNDRLNIYNWLEQSGNKINKASFYNRKFSAEVIKKLIQCKICSRFHVIYDECGYIKPDKSDEQAMINTKGYVYVTSDYCLKCEKCKEYSVYDFNTNENTIKNIHKNNMIVIGYYMRGYSKNLGHSNVLNSSEENFNKSVNNSKVYRLKAPDSQLCKKELIQYINQSILEETQNDLSKNFVSKNSKIIQLWTQKTGAGAGAGAGASKSMVLNLTPSPYIPLNIDNETLLKIITTKK